METVVQRVEVTLNEKESKTETDTKRFFCSQKNEKCPKLIHIPHLKIKLTFLLNNDLWGHEMQTFFFWGGGMHAFFGANNLRV
jgi:hypothetical protein